MDCVNHINTLRIIIEPAYEFQAPVYLLFVDYKQEFDSLSHEAMSSINIITGLYTDGSCRVLYRYTLWDDFSVASDTKAKFVLSPLVLILLLDWSIEW